MYYIHNVSRSVLTRVQRYQAAAHRGLVQRVDGRTILRGRPLVVSEAWCQTHAQEILKGVDAGVLEVRTADGLRVNLRTGAAELSKVPAQEAPVTVLDSINNDSPHIGRPLPIYPGGAIQSVAQPEPADATPVEEPFEGGVAEVEHTEADSRRNKKGRR